MINYPFWIVDELNDRVKLLEKLLKHTFWHVENDMDTCRICGQNFRDSVHCTKDEQESEVFYQHERMFG